MRIISPVTPMIKLPYYQDSQCKRAIGRYQLGLTCEIYIAYGILSVITVEAQ